MSLSLCDRFVDEVEKVGIPWEVLYGNHDLYGHNLNVSDASILSHIFRRSKKIYHLECICKDKILIQGYDYYHNIEKDIVEKGLYATSEYKPIDKKIAIVHAFITFEPFLPQVMHVTIDNIKTDFNLVLLAHYHAEQGIRTVGKTTYVGVGGLARLAVFQHDIHRIPSVVYVNTDGPILKVIQLKSARPSNEVFDLVRLNEVKSFDNSIDKFISSLAGAKFQSLNIRGIIEEMAKSKGYDREVIDEIIERIGKYEEIKC